MKRFAAAVLVLVVLPGAGAGQVSLLEPCTAGPLPARCGWFSVPEDRSRTDGPSLRLRVVLAPAPDSARRADPIVLLLGGPGDGAAAGAAQFAPPLRGLFPNRDLVFVDQRGTGDSDGLFCPGDRPESIDDPARLFGSIFPAEEVAACREELEARADLTRYLTHDAADDLADVLAATGYTRANLLGLSYGTRLAQVFARRHPEHVRSLVLSGVMSFDIRAPLFYARDAQDALDRVLAACEAQESCRGRYPALREDIRTAWSVLDDGPVHVRHVMPGDPGPTDLVLSKGDVAYAVRGMLYTTAGQEAIPATFTAAARGDWSAFVDRYLERRVRFFATGMHLSVLCSEEIGSITDEDVATATSGTFLGRHLVDDMRAACREWPLGPLPERFHQPLTTPVPTLLLSGEFDPVTPPRWATSVGEGLPHAHHVIIPGGGHGITAVRGDPTCVGSIVAEFVSSAGERPPETGCLALTPLPAFRD